MGNGFLGEYNVYKLSNNRTLLVEPGKEYTVNFELFKKSETNIDDFIFRGLRTIILNENEILVPVKIENGRGYYEGLFFLETR